VNRFPKVVIRDVYLRILTKELVNDVLARVDGRKVQGRNVFVAKAFLRDRNSVDLLSERFLDKGIVMKLIVAIVFKFHAWPDKELDKVTVAGSRDLCDFTSNTFVTIWLQLQPVTKVRHRKCLEERYSELAVDLPLGMSLEQVRYICSRRVFRHKSVVPLSISPCNFNLADVSTVGLFAYVASVNFLHQVLFDSWTLVHVKLLELEVT
jgi:hypothetical protein